MVHCITSSEPDSMDQNSDHEWLKTQHQIGNAQKMEYTEVSSRGHVHMSKKMNNPTHLAFAESSTMLSGLHFTSDQMKTDDNVVSSRNFENLIGKIKHEDNIVMDTSHLHPSLFDDDDEGKLKDFFTVYEELLSNFCFRVAK